MADIRAKNGIELDAEGVDLAFEGPGGNRIVSLTAKVEVRHKQIANILRSRDVAGAKVIKLLCSVNRQPLPRSRRQVLELINVGWGAVALHQIDQQVAIQISRVHCLQGLGVALFPMGNEITIEATCPADAAFEKSE